MAGEERSTGRARPADWSVAFMVHHFPLLSETFIATLAEAIIPDLGDFRILATSGQIAPPPYHAVIDRAGLLDRTHVANRHGQLELQRMGRLALAFPRKAFWLAGLTVFDRIAPSGRTALTRLLSRQPDFDIVHCQFGYEGLAALRHRRFGTLRTRALICHLRGSDITRYVREAGEDVYDELFEDAELLIANCEFFRQTAIGLGADPDKVEVIGSPIDTERFTPPRNGRDTYDGTRALRLVAVGRLVAKKGFGDAIEALALLEELDVRLDVLGDGPLRAELESLVGKLGLTDKVRFHGAATAQEIIEALHRADMALAPSVRASDGDADAPVNTLKEAMATGLPVIATDHGGIPELVMHGENGFLVPERSPPKIAQRIRTLAAMPEQWADMGKNGRRKVIEDYGLAAVAEKTLAAYGLALERSKPRD